MRTLMYCLILCLVSYFFIVGDGDWIRFKTPDNSFHYPRVADVKSGRWEFDGSPQLIVDYHIDPSMFPDDKIPSRVFCSVTLQEELRVKWRIYRVDITDSENPLEIAFHQYNGVENAQFNLFKLTEPKKRHSIRVYLHTDEAMTESQIKEYYDAIKGKQNIIELLID